MQIHVVENEAKVKVQPGDFILEVDNWNDYGYKTSFEAYFADDAGMHQRLGMVKIAHDSMSDDNPRTDLPPGFSNLPEGYFSAGQRVEYYIALAKLGDAGFIFSRSIRDIAVFPSLAETYADHPVLETSLLRSMPLETLVHQCSEILSEKRPATESFEAYFPPHGASASAPVITQLKFSVDTNSQPSSNVHALIGGNGTGKSTLLRDMARALLGAGTGPQFRDAYGVGLRVPRAALIAFSGFDDVQEFLPPYKVESESDPAGRFRFVGLQKIVDGSVVGKSREELAREFGEALEYVKSMPETSNLLRSSLEFFDGDPALDLYNLRNFCTDKRPWIKSASVTWFLEQSTGHGYCLLTLLSLIEWVQEKVVVLLDEPDSHLHPPLAASLTAAVSSIMTRMNGLCIIATHSPTVVQQLPRNCVTILGKAGDEYTFQRPEIETFGENVSRLTREVFGVEVSRAGFYRQVEQAVGAARSLDDVFAKLGGHLGSEAEMYATSLWMSTEHA